MSPSWTHLIRFVAEETGQIHLGQIDAEEYPDLGLATVEGKKITAKEITGSIFDGVVTNKILTVKQLLSPVSKEQAKIVRCLGLNYRDHAAEANMAIPKVPVLFIKPAAAVADPYPGKIIIPKVAQDGSSDYEGELTVVIGKTGKDIKEEDAYDYILGYTSGNDVSARNAQFASSQWCYSKGLDSSAPIGPVLVSPKAIPDPHNLEMKSIHNGIVVQETNTKEMIFNIPKTIAYLSAGTTLEAGSLIMTGTGPGIGIFRKPQVILNDGDDMRVYIEKIGTLVNKIYYE